MELTFTEDELAAIVKEHIKTKLKLRTKDAWWHVKVNRFQELHSVSFRVEVTNE
jgi:hypothetical protein